MNELLMNSAEAERDRYAAVVRMLRETARDEGWTSTRLLEKRTAALELHRQQMIAHRVREETPSVCWSALLVAACVGAVWMIGEAVAWVVRH